MYMLLFIIWVIIHLGAVVRRSYGFPSPMAIASPSLFPRQRSCMPRKRNARPQFFQNCACADSIHRNESKKIHYCSTLSTNAVPNFKKNINQIASNHLLSKNRYLGSYWSDVENKKTKIQVFWRTLRCS